MWAKTAWGFQTGDLIKANVPKGKYQGVHVGRVAVRKTGYFDIVTSKRKVTVSHEHGKCLQRCDGYEYSIRPFSVQ
jgi:hypothetical protein